MHVLKMVPFFAVLLVANCQKQESLAAENRAPISTAVLLPSSEQSVHFGAVCKHLELGGALFSYVDVQSEKQNLLKEVDAVVAQYAAVRPEQAAFLNYVRPTWEAQVFNDIKAIGTSSVMEANGILRTRSFLYVPGERTGLLAALGGQPDRFQYMKYAPSDADLVSESELNLSFAYTAIKAAVAKVDGAEAATRMDAAIEEFGKKANKPILDLINSVRGRAVLVLRVDSEKTFALSADLPVIPAISVFVRIEGAACIQSSLQGLAFLESSRVGELTVYASKAGVIVDGLKPVLAVDSDVYYFASSIEFLKECLADKPARDPNSELNRAAGVIGETGNGMLFLTPRLCARLKHMDSINLEAKPAVKRLIDVITKRIPDLKQPVVATRSNLPDGILFRSFNDQFTDIKGEYMTVLSPLVVGQACSIAFCSHEEIKHIQREMATKRKEREEKMKADFEVKKRGMDEAIAMQEKRKKVRNNLRLLSEAANRYYSEHNVSTVTYDEMVGPGKYIESLTSVVGEDYHSVELKRDQPLKVQWSDGRWQELTP